MTTRIGVIADTHHPEFLKELPISIADAFSGVDLILHAGDIGGRQTIDKLNQIAPVKAVRGDHDKELIEYPLEQELQVEGVKIGLVHGNRSHLIEEPLTLLQTFALGQWWPTYGIAGYLRGRFKDADLVIYGHTHMARYLTDETPRLLNPGAIYHVSPAKAHERLATGPALFEATWLRVMLLRRRWPRPTVSVLTIDGTSISNSFIPLT